MMMKNLTFLVVIIVVATSCSDVRRSRGREYMPDMAYSRAYETYADHDRLRAQNINYNAMPVPGTIQRGEVFPFSIPRDREGDSVNYVASKQVQNPFDSLDATVMKEAERMYLIHCGICHGSNLEGNGPLYNGGNGPYPAAPRNLIADPVVSVMPEGQMFYSVTYGKGAMGPYSSQLTTSQRWAIVRFVKSRQIASKNGDAAPAGAGTGDGGSGAATGGTDGGGTTPGARGPDGSGPNPTPATNTQATPANN